MLLSLLATLHRFITCIAVGGLSLLAFSMSSQAQVITESPEVIYSGQDARLLREKAAQLGTAVAIYEYVHNFIEYSPYHGSRSGSLNTFLGQRGSDVDIASALIAMLRSQSIPARYAVGTVRLSATQLTNWLGIPQLDTAVEVLKVQGIQAVTISSDRSTVDFEHAWAEAFIPFDQYRGINSVTPSVNCSRFSNAPRCTWVALDASFKQKTYNSLGLDPYNALTFDYAAYYNAIKNNDQTRRDKNPLSILEDQIGAWLRTNYPGKTLQDVEDAGKIVELREGLLPASLPYQIVGSVRRYDTIALHDAVVPSVEPKKWGKTVSPSVRFEVNGFTISADIPPILLAEVNTKRLTLTTEFGASGGVPSMVLRLGGVTIKRVIDTNSSVPGFVPTVGYPFTLTLLMDGAPGAISTEADRTVSAEYSAIVGGYYVIATGGESSNWSQVHRAAEQLLASNDQYKIVFNPSEIGCASDGANCTPYVDSNGNGWDASDTKLLENKLALDALTGGLLQVSAMQYFAKLREHIERADHLMKTKTPIIGFLGVVSSVYEAEYIDGTAFSILPGGLLIDVKGATIGGSYRTNESAINYSNRQFEFLGHITSSLEHETWQELTGYDAVSTVRGIQMALGSGASLLSVKSNATVNTLPNFMSAVGFGGAAQSPFTISQRDVYGTRPTTWLHSTASFSDGFDVVKKTPSGSMDTRLSYLSYYNDYWHDNIECFDFYEGQLINLRATYGGAEPLPAFTACGVSWIDGTTIDGAISKLQTGYSALRAGNAGFFNYLDVLQGFVATDFYYRSTALAVNAYSTNFIAGIRNDLQLRDVSKFWVEYLLPSTLVTGATYRFEVDIRKLYTSSDNRLYSLFFEIANRSLVAGGGYVGLDTLALTADKNTADAKAKKAQVGE
jgi:Transglutaminase-like superfamily